MLSGFEAKPLRESSVAALRSELSTVTLPGYEALRSYAGNARNAVISAPSIAGNFTVDDADTTSTDNGGTVIVTSSGKRWKRVFDGAVDVRWFGAKGDGTANDTAAFTAAGNTKGTGAVQVDVPAGTWNLVSAPTPTGVVTWVVHAGASFAGVANPLATTTSRIVRYSGPQGPLLLQSNRTNVAGEALGLYIHIGDNPTATPGAGDSVAQTITINNLNGRQHLWGLNIVVTQDSSGLDGVLRGLEVEIANVKSFVADPFSGGSRKNGIELIMHGASTFKGSAALMLWANDASGSGWWNEGIALARCFQYGVHFYKDAGGTDLVNPFSVAAIFDSSNSENVLKVNGTHGSVIDLSTVNGITRFVKMHAASNSTLPFSNAADFSTTIELGAGSTASQQAYFALADRGTQKWWLLKGADNTFNLFDVANGRTVFTLATSGNDPTYVFVNNALKQVTKGANDSGGAGFSVLRVAN